MTVLHEPELETVVPPPNPPNGVTTATGGDEHEGEIQCSLCLTWLESNNNEYAALEKHRDTGECRKMFPTRGERISDDRQKQLLQRSGEEDAELED